MHMKNYSLNIFLVLIYILCLTECKKARFFDLIFYENIFIIKNSNFNCILLIFCCKLRRNFTLIDWNIDLHVSSDILHSKFCKLSCHSILRYIPYFTCHLYSRLTIEYHTSQLPLLIWEEILRIWKPKAH